ncbi:MAG TPA: ATP-binding protein [Candidatus Paceibacterota bacterium]|nr:ATP-binding protein [Candidatus Paceibacterota bacterium]
MDTINILIVIIAITNFLLGSLFLYHKNTTSRVEIFSTLAFTIACWSFLMGVFRVVSDPRDLKIYLHFLYAVPVFIPALFLYFNLLFLEIINKERERVLRFLIFFSAIIIFGLTLLTDTIVVRAVHPIAGENTIFFGNGYFIYVAYFVFFFSTSFFLLLRRYFILQNSEKNFKKQIFALFLGTFIPSVCAVATNLILPWAGVFALNWLGQMVTFFFVLSILYAIYKYQLLDIKIIATELLVLLIWLFTLTLFLFETTAYEKIFDGFVLLLSLVFGVYLVRRVKKEAIERERMQHIAAEIHSVNKKLKVLDRQKTEFISLASHQLRTPLTAVKGYASMLLEGSFGKIEGRASEAVEDIFNESQTLARSVENLLVVSRIEQGRVQYNFANIDFKEIVRESFKEALPNAKEKNVEMTLEVYGGNSYLVSGDREKLKLVIQNLLENAVQYTEEGFIRILLVRDSEKKVIRLSVSDTGVGMNAEELGHAFDGFQDPEMEEKMMYNFKTGMGLYISREFIKAHDGKIWGESPGSGRGSTFFVEVPFLDPSAAVEVT